MLFIVIFLLLGGFIYSIAYGMMVRDSHPPTGAFELIDGVRIHYKDIAPKKGDLNAAALPIVLIHGANCNSLDMEIALASKLAEQRRVILIDRPGQGHSQRSSADGYRLDVQARVISKLLKRRGISKAIILGQSYGGSVALSFALNHQDQTAGLVLLAPVAYRWPGGVAWHFHLASLPIIGTVFRWGILPLYGTLVGRKAVAEGFWPGQPPDNYFENAAKQLLFTPQRFKANASDLVHLYEEIARIEHRYGDIKVPTRILSGTHDAIVLTSLHSIGLAEDIDQAELAILPDTGHTIQHVAGAEICQAVLELAQEIS